MKIVWTRRASGQLASAYAYILEDSFSAAGRQVDNVLRAAQQLLDFPEMGRIGRVPGTREMVVQGTPYVVAYRVRKNSVRIVALLHSSRRWPDQL